MTWKLIEGRSRDLWYEVEGSTINYKGTVPNLFNTPIPVSGSVELDPETKITYSDAVIRVYLDIDAKYHI